MGKVRIPDELHDEVRNFIDQSSSYYQQKEFVTQAIREKLDSNDKKHIEKLVDEKLDKKLDERL